MEPLCALVSEGGASGGAREEDGPLGEVSGRREVQPFGGSWNGTWYGDAWRSIMHFGFAGISQNTLQSACPSRAQRKTARRLVQASS